jgi:hypothetical protein
VAIDYTIDVASQSGIHRAKLSIGGRRSGEVA